jgi:2-methylisocitrate lyase-like PEP mutase family enzyme
VLAARVTRGYVRAMIAPTVAAFRALHDSGCFVMPNPWDVGSARFFAHAGFRALASTSAGFAFARGLADGPNAVPLDAALAHLRELAAATPLPVNADFQNGYARDPEGVAANVRACIATGVAGLSIEDSSGDAAAPIYDRALAIERIRAARAAIDASASGVVLTGRCEAFLVGHPDAARLVPDRLAAYAEAGADCLYAPLLPDLDAVASVVKLVAPRPVNVLVSSPQPGVTVAKLAELGVRRISIGSGLACVAWGAIARATAELATHGTFGGFADRMSFGELMAIFGAAK